MRLGFFTLGAGHMFGGGVFRGSGVNFLFGEARKFGVIFLKYALQLFKIWQIMEKISGKKQIFPEYFRLFCGRCGEK